MREPVYLGVDQGTRSSKSVVCNAYGDELFLTRAPVSIDDRGDGTVEQDPSELLTSVRSVLDQAIDFCDSSKFDIRGIGFAAQRSGVCAWRSKNGDVLHPLITWADRRTQPEIDALGTQAEYVAEATSLPVLSYYAAGKFSRLQREFPDDDALVGTLDSFLLWNLLDTKPFQTDDTMAARTMLYAIDSHEWDPELARIFDINRERLPRIAPSFSRWGNYRGVPIVASMGDQQAALLALRNSQHDIVINFGSIVSLLVPTDQQVMRQTGFVSSILYSYEEGSKRRFQHLTEGIVNAAACVIDHLQSEMKMIQGPSELDDLCNSSLKKNSENTSFLPIGGTASPDWLEGLPIIVRGWDRHSSDDYVRAAVESIAGFVIRQLDILQDAGVVTTQGKAVVSGGLSQCRYLLQFIADCSGMTLETTAFPESTAHGAAYAAKRSLSDAQGTNLILHSTRVQETFNPNVTSSARNRYQRWLELMNQSRNTK